MAGTTIEISEYVIDAIADAVVKKMQKPCEDAISRKAIIDMTGLSEWFDSSDSYNEFVIALSELPSVTQKQKIGHWIADVDKWGDIVTTVNGYICSECGTFNADNDNYCPNCGAKMESEDKE